MKSIIISVIIAISAIICAFIISDALAGIKYAEFRNNSKIIESLGSSEIPNIRKLELDINESNNSNNQRFSLVKLANEVVFREKFVVNRESLFLIDKSGGRVWALFDKKNSGGTELKLVEVKAVSNSHAELFHSELYDFELFDGCEISRGGF